MAEFYQLPPEYVRPLQRCFDALAKSSILFFDTNLSWYTKTVRPVIIKCFVSAYFTSLTIYLSNVFHGDVGIYELTYSLPVYTVTLQALLRGINTTKNKNRLISLILELGTMWRTKNLNEIQLKKKEAFLKKINYSCVACCHMVVIASWQYMLAPICKTLFVRFVLNEESKMMLPFACSFPFDTENNWMKYAIAYIFQVFSMLGVIYYFVGSEILMITLSGLLSTEFVILQDDFLNAKSIVNTEEMADNYNGSQYLKTGHISTLIKRHQILIKLTDELDDIYNKLIFVNLSSGTIIITFFALAAKVARGPVDMMNNFIGVVALLIPLFNLCYFSEQLQQSSTSIADAVYNSTWYKGNKSYNKLIWFMICRAQTPCSLTSLKYKPISLSTFSAILSTTWSYFSLASSLCDDRN